MTEDTKDHVGKYVTTERHNLGTGVITMDLGIRLFRVKFPKTEATLRDDAFRDATEEERATAQAAGVKPVDEDGRPLPDSSETPPPPQ